MVRLCTPGDGRPLRSSPRLAQRRDPLAWSTGQTSSGPKARAPNARPSAPPQSHIPFCDEINDIENMDPKVDAKHDANLKTKSRRKVAFALSPVDSVKSSGRKRANLAGAPKLKRSALPPLTDSQHTLTQLEYLVPEKQARPSKRRRLPSDQTRKLEQITITQMPFVTLQPEARASDDESDHLGYESNDEEMSEADHALSYSVHDPSISSTGNNTGRPLEIPDSEDEGLEDDGKEGPPGLMQSESVNPPSMITARPEKVESIASGQPPTSATHSAGNTTSDASSAQPDFFLKHTLNDVVPGNELKISKIARKQLRTPQKQIVPFIPSSQSPQSCLTSPSKSSGGDTHSPSKRRRPLPMNEIPVHADISARSPSVARTSSLNHVDAVPRSNTWKSSSSFNVEHPASSPDMERKKGYISISDTDTESDYDVDCEVPRHSLPDKPSAKETTTKPLLSNANFSKLPTPVCKRITKDTEDNDRPVHTAMLSDNQSPATLSAKMSPTKARVAQLNARWAELRKRAGGVNRRELRGIDKAPPFVASSTRTSTWSTGDEESSRLEELETQFDIGEDTQAELKTVVNPEDAIMMIGVEHSIDQADQSDCGSQKGSSLSGFDTNPVSEITPDDELVFQYHTKHTTADKYSDPRTSQELVSAQLLSETQALAHQRGESQFLQYSGQVSVSDKSSHASIRPSQATTVGSSPAPTPRTSQRYRFSSPSQLPMCPARNPSTTHVKPLLQQNLPLGVVLAARSSSLPPQPPSPNMASSPPLHPSSSQAVPNFRKTQGSIPTATQLLPESLLDDSIPLPPPWND